MTRRALPVNEAQSSVTVALLLFVLNLTYWYYKLNNMMCFRVGHHVMVGRDHFAEHGAQHS